MSGAFYLYEMKLLVLASRFPYPLEKGDKLRLYYQLKEFARHHEVILIALHEEPITAEAYAAVAAFCPKIYTLPIKSAASVWHAVRAFMTGRPLQVGYFWRSRLQREIRHIIEAEAPDHIFCQLIRMADYARAQKPPTSLDYMDCFSLGTARRAASAPAWQAWLWRREARLLGAYEQAIYDEMHRCYIISDQDRKALGLAAGSKVSISPNGLDLQRFTPMADVPETADITFVGNMGYFPNVQAACYLVDQLMPAVWELRPEATVLLAGARPAPAVQRLGQDPRVNVTGWVEDIRMPYQQGRVFVAPLFAGSGQQNKILEALALGRPCLTTPLVNDAIGAPPAAIALASSAEEFVAQIIRLLDNPATRADMGQAGQDFVRAQMDWAEAIKPILAGFTSPQQTAGSELSAR